MYSRYFLCFIAIFILFTNASYAGVIVGGVRVVYHSDKKEASLSIKNPDKNTDYLIQSWIENGDVKNKNKVPFVITPPLQRLNSGDETLLRIINTVSLPQDKESQYWLNVKSIAAVDDAIQNRLQITIRTRIKLFYRPASIAEGAAEAYKKIIFTRQGNMLQAKNPTPYFITFQSVKVGNAEVKEPGMVAPFGTLLMTAPDRATGAISWQAINDYGSPTVVAK
jgi:P pilus assembly chaperone PapD